MDKDKVLIENFWDKGKHLTAGQLGWQRPEKEEARSLVSKEIFEFEVVEVGWNMSFYYLDNDTFYGIHSECIPTEVKILPRDRTIPYLNSQCECDTHVDGEVIASFDDPHDIWDNLKIDGKSLEEVLERSVIIVLN